MSACCDTDTGEMLHAYELRLLTAEETERFEIHLLRCCHCFARLTRFEENIFLMTEDEQVKSIFGHAFGGKRRSVRTLPERLRAHLWPAAVFKPAFAYIAVILLIIPAYFLMVRTERQAPGVYQSIHLYDFRSARDPVFKMDAGLDGEIKFRIPDAVPGQSYGIIIKNEKGDEIFRDASFSGFDAFGVGSTIFPREEMKPGRYTITIIDSTVDPPLETEKIFRIID